MLLWGIEKPDSSASATRARAMIDLNGALELLWANAEQLDYFNQTTIEVTLPGNTESLALEAGIQKIIGPVRLASGQQLNPVATRYEAENFGPIYVGVPSLPNGPPIAYYLQRQFQSEADSIALTIFPLPIPAVATPIKLDVVMDCPSYTYDDYCAGTVIPIPHEYGESILIPLARHSAMSHSLFVVPARAPMIEAQYLEARKLLGLVAPEETEVAKKTNVPDPQPQGRR
jgi:hypothetical protein